MVETKRDKKRQELRLSKGRRGESGRVGHVPDGMKKRHALELFFIPTNRVWPIGVQVKDLFLGQWVGEKAAIAHKQRHTFGVSWAKEVIDLEEAVPEGALELKLFFDRSIHIESDLCVRKNNNNVKPSVQMRNSNGLFLKNELGGNRLTRRDRRNKHFHPSFCVETDADTALVRFRIQQRNNGSRG